MHALTLPQPFYMSFLTTGTYDVQDFGIDVASNGQVIITCDFLLSTVSKGCIAVFTCGTEPTSLLYRIARNGTGKAEAKGIVTVSHSCTYEIRVHDWEMDDSLSGSPAFTTHIYVPITEPTPGQSVQINCIVCPLYITLS